MKTASIFVAVCATLLVMSGCSQSPNAPSALSEDANSTTTQATQQAAGTTGTPEAGERKFIRTSGMKFRVKDVASATSAIEQITRQNQGFVTYTNLESKVEEQKTAQKSMDSSLESIRYTVVNEITLRVPNAKLDSTLYAIATLVDYMDYRIIKADDVGLQLKANQKAQQRSAFTSQRLRNTVDTKSGKISDATATELTAAQRQQAADEQEITNLALLDQVEYSTVNLSIYQSTATKYWTVANDNNLARTSTGIRLWDAVKTGWQFAEDIFVGMLKLWFVLLLAAIGYWLYRKYFQKKIATWTK